MTTEVTGTRGACTFGACKLARALGMVTCLIAGRAVAADGTGTFIHFESPHVHPAELMPGGARLVVANTPDGRIEVFDVLGAHPYLRHAGSIAVGVEPVSVRARSANEVWVVNNVSDTISVVDLAFMRVAATIETGDDPFDVVFAGSPERAFVSASGLDRIEIFDPAAPDAAPVLLPLAGDMPRALATDGTRVYVAFFGAGNETTVLDEATVSSALSPYPGAPNPPPNDGFLFTPAPDPGLPPAAPAALIVRRDAKGAWRDVNGFDWSAAVTWDFSANDLAAIDTVIDATSGATSPSVAYAHGLMTTPLGMTVDADGRVIVVGTESRNEIRFEPNLRGVFVRAEAAVLAPGAAGDAPALLARGDLNPHLSYVVPQVPFADRLASLGDPRMVVASADGTRAYVAGMGSSNVIAFDPSSLARVARCDVGEGPTGLALDGARSRLYVLNRFSSTVSVIDETSFAEVAEVGFFDPLPFALTRGRKFLYDSHLTSGLGQASCASCHIDARSDGLVWDMGSPAGAMEEFNQVCNLELGAADECAPWHPMKGPMASQTLLGLAGNEPFHWRGDRAYIANFAQLARTLQGMERDLTETELKHLDDYLTAIAMTPNPNRARDGALRTNVGGGDAARGQALFHGGTATFGACARCHASPAGGGAGVFSIGLVGDSQQLTIPDLRQAFMKTGFDRAATSPGRGFGFGHDGSGGSLVEFLAQHIVGLVGSSASEQDRRDLAAFVLSWDTGMHPAVGAQATVDGSAASQARRDGLIGLALAGHAELIAKCVVEGVERGFLFNGLGFLSDVTGEVWSASGLDAIAASGVPVTYTLVPSTMGARALDRDGDGFADGDERASCTDPADPLSQPSPCRADIAGADGAVDGADLAAVLNAWGSAGGAADLDCSGSVDGQDLAEVLNAWGACR